ncbi:hypothetical protein PIROE2DRAFT_14375 [Piromyces sp. E2]|nr:hypothetical protein PIROE2DRAFT_14375 [Piromyces sp. E2]|eukprot:OUM59963.1 hypothetical protein PIROE2DRAFT_14375 [Piromyces sp. E2]
MPIDTFVCDRDLYNKLSNACQNNFNVIGLYGLMVGVRLNTLLPLHHSFLILSTATF